MQLRNGLDQWAEWHSPDGLMTDYRQGFHDMSLLKLVNTTEQAEAFRRVNQFSNA